MKKFFHNLTTLLFVGVLLATHSIVRAESSQPSGVNAANVPAFPGAEGFGAGTIGGRGGKVFEVVNLNDSGTGSLRACVAATGARICVFRIGGLIKLQSALVITNPYITIAGQTAPGGGITLKRTTGGDALLIKTHDVILRYITSRPGPGGENHAAQAASNGVPLYNIIIDHCSFSWGTDEVLETWYKVSDTTIQWSIVSEGLDCSTHPKGCHSKGLMVGGYADSESKTNLGSENISVHHNLFAHNGERNPLIQTSGLVDVVNNVAYNPFGTFMYLYMKSNSIVPVNYVGNYYKYGPDTDSGKYEIKVYDDGGLGADVYVLNNIGPHRASDNLAQELVVESGSRSYLTTTRHPAPPITTTSATVAYEQVLAEGGNSKGLTCDGLWFNRRDSIDARVVNDVVNRTGHIIDDPSEVGGWIVPSSGVPCVDTDHDGMPDTWEISNDFDPNNGSDGNADADGDGYTNIEEYLNGTTSADVVSQESILNGGFNTYAGASKTPTGWTTNQFTSLDGKDTKIKYEGTASVKMIGVAKKLKTFSQTLQMSGVGGETFNYSFQVKGKSIPTKGIICEGLVILFNAGVETHREVVACPSGTYGFREMSLTFTAPEAFDKVIVRFRFKSVGTVWFDLASLTR